MLRRWSAATGTTNDALGNLLTINYPSSPAVTVAYDALNRVTNMVDAAGTTHYGYTAMSQLLTEDGPFASDTVTSLYNNGLRMGRRSDYVYDGLGRCRTRTDYTWQLGG